MRTWLKLKTCNWDLCGPLTQQSPCENLTSSQKHETKRWPHIMTQLNMCNFPLTVIYFAFTEISAPSVDKMRFAIFPYLDLIWTNCLELHGNTRLSMGSKRALTYSSLRRNRYRISKGRVFMSHSWIELNKALYYQRSWNGMKSCVCVLCFLCVTTDSQTERQSHRFRHLILLMSAADC